MTNSQKLINFIEENEGMDEVINSGIEQIIAQKTKEIQAKVDKLEKKNEELYDRMRIFEEYLAYEDLIQNFIEYIESDMDFVIENGYIDKDFDWAIEKQMIKEYQVELDMINSD